MDGPALLQNFRGPRQANEHVLNGHHQQRLHKVWMNDDAPLPNDRNAPTFYSITMTHMHGNNFGVNRHPAAQYLVNYWMTPYGRRMRNILRQYE